VRDETDWEPVKTKCTSVNDILCTLYNPIGGHFLESGYA